MSDGPAYDLVVRDARLLDGRVRDLGVVGEELVAAAPPGTLDAPSSLDADGRLVTPACVDAHLHLDKVYTLPRAGEEALAAYTAGDMGGAAAGVAAARAVKESYDHREVAARAHRALTECVRHGTLTVQAFADVDTTAGLEGVRGVLAAREAFRGVVDVRVVAFPQEGVFTDPGAAALCAEALDLGADVVGGIPWVEDTDDEARRHVAWACDLAARRGRRVAMLTDDAGDPSLRTTELLAAAMLDHGLVGRGVACHARAVGTYAEPAQRRLAALARRAGLGLVSAPHTGPLHLPVDLFDRLGVPVALGQDDVEDAYYPFGRGNLLEVAFLAAHRLGLLTDADQRRLLAMVTTAAARVLGLPGAGLVEGARADLAVHDAERLVDVLRAHAAPRWVVSRGHVVAETTRTSAVTGVAPLPSG